MIEPKEHLRLIKQAVRGNPDAYGKLITDHQEYLYKMAFLYMKNKEGSLDLDGSGKVIQDKIGQFSPKGYDLSKITVYSLDLPDKGTNITIQEKLPDDGFSSQLPEWLEENAISKIEIPIED